MESAAFCYIVTPLNLSPADRTGTIMFVGERRGVGVGRYFIFKIGEILMSGPKF